MKTVVVIGSLTKDRIIINKSGADFNQTGGGVYYSSHALACLGVEVLACPLLAKRDEELLRALQHPRIKIFPQWTEETTSYQNTYPYDSLDRCEKKCLAYANHFKPNKDLLAMLQSSDAIHLVPLSSEEFELDCYRELRKNFCKWISLDGQGFTQGPLLDVKNAVRGNCDILKNDEAETLFITKTKGENEALMELASWGILEILITKASRGSVLFYQGKAESIPPHQPEKIVDATGCGDAYLAGYLKKRLDGATPLVAAQFASFLGAKNIEVQGALSVDLLL